MSDVGQGIANAYASAWAAFREHALAKGFKHKIVGDEAFSRDRRRPGARIMRLIGAYADERELLVFEEGVGRYRIPWTPPTNNGDSP